MPFKFKLSKRLALLKASLAAGAALVLACDRTDLTSPQPFPGPLAATVTSLPVVSVVASAHDGNVPQNTLDGNVSTRWSALGDGQWIRYDLGVLTAIDRVSIAWYLGNPLVNGPASFDIDVSPDAVTWTRVFAGRSSGLTTQPETYAFPTAAARYVRIVGHGNTMNSWNSITEVTITVVARLAVASVAASAHDGNAPQNTVDKNLGTRWSAHGDGQWIRYDLGAPATVDGVSIAWYLGDPRVNGPTTFDIDVSPDAVAWTRVLSGRSSGLTTQSETYTLPATSGRYVRIMGHGNTLNGWNSLTEVAIHGTNPPPPPPPPPPSDAPLAVAGVGASGDDGNVPQNTLDQNLATRWSALGDGQWIRYDLGAPMTVSRVDVAWYRGNEWASAFDIEASPDAVTWTKVFAGRSSGQTLEPERYAFPAVTSRYVRILGHGQWSGTTRLSLWNSVTEMDLYGSAAVADDSVSVTALLPGTVTDLAVVGVTDTGATLAFTEVNDGTGLPASYDVRVGVAPMAWGGVPSVSRGTCATPVAGSAIGARRTCTVLGLQAGTTYEVQLVAFRGTLTVNAVFGGLSNVARAITAPSTAGAGAGPTPGPSATIIFQDGFESGTLGQWEQIPNNGRYSVATTAARVKSGTRSLQALFTPTNGYGMLTRWFMPGYDEVYVKFYVLFEEGFQNRRDDGAGMHFLVLAGNRIDNKSSASGKAGVVPNGTDFFYAGVDPEEVSLPTLRPFSFYTYYPDMSCCYGNEFFQQAPKIDLLGGQWQEVVFHVKLNTPGQFNGSQTLWINGVKKIEMLNMRWRTTTDLTLNQLRFDNYMPGGPKTQHIWVDDVTVWRP